MAKDNTILIVSAGAIGLLALNGAFAGPQEQEQQETGGSGSNVTNVGFGNDINPETLELLQKSSVPVTTKKEIKRIVQTVQGSPDTLLDSIDVIQNNDDVRTYTSVRTSGGSSTSTAKKLAFTPNNITFIKNEQGETQGAYDNIRRISTTKKEAQRLEANKNNPISNLIGGSSRNFTPAPSKKSVKTTPKKEEKSFFEKRKDTVKKNINFFKRLF